MLFGVFINWQLNCINRFSFWYRCRCRLSSLYLVQPVDNCPLGRLLIGCPRNRFFIKRSDLLIDVRFQICQYEYKFFDFDFLLFIDRLVSFILLFNFFIRKRWYLEYDSRNDFSVYFQNYYFVANYCYCYNSTSIDIKFLKSSILFLR